jgi:hypothetical protein
MFKNFIKVALLSFTFLPLAFAEVNPYTWKERGVYFEGDLGYLFRHWSRDNDLLRPIFLNFSHNQGGFTGGADIGLQANPWLAAEVGAFYVPTVTLNTPWNANRVRSYFVYPAGKLMVPLARVLPNLSAFIKAGAAYRYSNFNTACLNHHDEWRPLLGIGTLYYFNPNLSVNFQWMFVERGSNVFHKNILVAKSPSYNLFTVGIGYRFVF